jgi:hypothetical protein
MVRRSGKSARRSEARRVRWRGIAADLTVGQPNIVLARC